MHKTKQMTRWLLSLKIWEGMDKYYNDKGETESGHVEIESQERK